MAMGGGPVMVAVKAHRIRVEQGIIKVNQVLVLQATATVIRIAIDCAPKYPAVDAAGYDGIMLGADDSTLYADDCAGGLTRISITNLDEDWIALTETGRYVVNAVFLRKKTRNSLGLKSWKARR